jgi:hypothetical protein
MAGKILCINSAREWVCKFKLKLRVNVSALWLIFLWQISGMLLNLQLVIMYWFNCAKKLSGLVLCNLQFFAMPKKQHFEKNSRIGLCDPPSGSLCLTFREMANSLHEQSAMVTILNSNRPKP